MLEPLTCITVELLMYTVYNTIIPFGDDGGLHFMSMAYELTVVTATLSGASEGTIVEESKRTIIAPSVIHSSVYHLPVWSQCHRLDWIIL